MPAAEADAPAYALTTLDNGWLVGRFAALDSLPAIRHAVTTRRALDVRRIADGRAAAAAEIAAAVGLEAVAFCRQVHGARVLPVEQGALAGEADGLITGRPGLGLMVVGADCPLILVADPAGGACGAAHASWRGTLQQVAAALVGAMAQQLGANPANLVACIAPSAGPCCFEVGGEVLTAATTALGLAAERFFRAHPAAAGKFLFDLWAANRDQLLGAGIRRENLHVADVCTLCHNDLYPSHRREGPSAGRFAAVVGITGRRGCFTR